MPATADQIQEMAARLKAFGVIMRLGHDLFNAADFQTAAVMAVNNARPVVGFASSTLLWVQDKKVDIISQYAQAVTNVNSRQAVLQRDLLEHIGKLDDVLEISAANAGEFGDGNAARELCPDDVTLLLVPLKPPPFLKEPAFQLVWLLEFPGKVPPYALTAAKLLASSYAEALYCQRIGNSRIKAFRRRSFISLKLLFWILVIAGLVYVMFQKIPEKVNAEFELIAPSVTTIYAPFDGQLARCERPDGTPWKNGDFVKAGDVIAVYDKAPLEFRFEAAKQAVKEIEAEIRLKDRDRLQKRENNSEIQLLKEKKRSIEVSVAEAEWYLNRVELRAPRDGFLQLADPRAENLVGKAVRTGDKVFDVFSDKRPDGTSGMDVKVPVNEQESSILLKKPETITLYLHTAPDTPIEATVREISPTPELTEQRTYCYNLFGELPADENQSLRYGMRGIAKIEGDEVTVGYFLFKSVILYFRGI